MKKIYLILLFYSCSLSFFAQQAINYTHEFYKPMISNPAFTGYSEDLNVLLISRSQWINFRNAPQLNIFTIDGMFENKKMGLGVNLFTDKKGISNKVGGNFYYSYWLRFNEQTKLSFGIALGVIDHTLQYSDGVVEDPSDPFLVGTAQRETSITGNFGIAFIWKKLELGVSVPQLLGNTLEYQDNISGKANYALTRYYKGTVKYKFMFSESKQFSLTPMVLVHYLPSAPLQYDANLNSGWKGFWIGATYKSDYAVAANAGVCINKKFYVGYSYDFMIGSIGSYSGMSHEIMLNFVFGKNKEKAEADPKPEVESNNDKVKADSLQTELEIKENKIRIDSERILELKELAEKLRKENEKLKKAEVQRSDSLNRNPAPVPNLSPAKSVTVENKTVENGTVIMSATTNDYSYLNNKPAKKGFYVITGTFLNMNFAEDEVKRVRSLGYASAKILFSSAKQFNYVSASFHSKKEDAINKINEIRAQGAQTAWILSVQ